MGKKKELMRSLMERKATVCASACVLSFLSVLTAKGMLCAIETSAWGLNNSGGMKLWEDRIC